MCVLLSGFDVELTLEGQVAQELSATYIYKVVSLFVCLDVRSYLMNPCMPSPLASDSIRVQSCVCCLF